MVASPRPNPYHRLSIGQKQAAAREQQAEPPMACPVDCGVSLLPADVMKHVAERCPGPREPGPASKWISHRDALAAGVPKQTLSFWAAHGDVRTRGQRGGKQYLMRDLTHRLVIQRLSRRR